VKRNDIIKIDSLSYPVYLGDELWDKIREYLQPFLLRGGIFFLTDENTDKFCFPALLKYLPELSTYRSFSIKPGESSKEPAVMESLWKWLTESGAVRDSLLVNLGGGVVSDLGGFLASTFKRGMPYINIPTSLVGQADAAVGGKTGINLSGNKNQAGAFYDPAAVFIIPGFLETLPEDHFRSGFAEIIKSAALAGNEPWKQLRRITIPEINNIRDLIYETVKIKCSIVSQDPFDRSVRKMLNFGHTTGHALESLHNQLGMRGMLHGEAVATGMVCESFLSSEITGLPVSESEEIISVIKRFFRLQPVKEEDFNELMRLMDHDKKRTAGSYNFSLLESIGKPRINCPVDLNNILRSFRFLNKMSQA
jgi:3-dehydroquinate synthase